MRMTSVHSISSNVPQILEAFLSFFLKKDRSYCSPGIHSVRPGGPGTHRDLFAFAPQMLGLKAFAIPPGLESIFKFKNYLNATLKI